MRKLLLSLSFISLLTTCMPDHKTESAQTTAKPAAQESHGLDLAGMDKSVPPGDDFFRYANGTWLQNTPIPPDRSSTGVFVMLDEEATKRNRELMEQAGSAAAGSELRKIGDYFAAWMDEKTIEAKGLEPLEPELGRIAAVADRKMLSAFLGGQMRADVDPLNATNFHTDRLLGVWVSPDFDKPDVNAPYLLQGGLGMPDRDNYLNSDSDSKALQAKYLAHIEAVLSLAGVPDAAAKAKRIYDLEKKIASVHVTRTDSMDVLKASNRWQAADFPKKAPGLDWDEYFNAAGLSNQPYFMVWHPSAVTGISALAASAPLADWKDYLRYHVIDRSSPLLPKAFVEENFKFYGTAVMGTTKLRDRWKLAVIGTNAALGDAVGKIYVQRYFPPQAKKAAQEMVSNIIAAFGRRIDNLAWMKPETREKAKAKVSTLYVGIGYPDRWRDYSGLQVDRADALGNSERAALFDYRTAMAKIGKPVDKTEWWMTPQTVNALNIPLQNSLNFPAAILAPPFFDAQADPVQNYGAIGTVIGHEISHSFDDQGSQFDAQGRLQNWWTKEDFAHFSEAAKHLVDQYNAYEALPGLHLNGKLTLSENIADVAGLSASYDGYRAAYGGKEAPAAQGFTGDQRFFLSFAQIWRTKMRPEALRNSIVTNGHAPGEYRADTVRNHDAWYTAFQVQPGQKLYLDPKARVQVW